jgi:hypothetical protein
VDKETIRLAYEYVESVPDDRYNAEHIDRDALIQALGKALAEAEKEYRGARLVLASDGVEQRGYMGDNNG